MFLRPGRYISACLGIFLLGSFDLQGMEWPDSTARIRENFGTGMGNQGPTLGHTFLSGGVLRAAQTGEVIFQRKVDDGASIMPSPLGSWIAIDHGEGIIGIYARFDDHAGGIASAEPRRIVEKGSVLGTAGASGWATERGFYFSLFDRKERRWVNPSMLISPIADTRPPTIRSVVLAGRDGTAVNIAQGRSLRQGTYRILVDAFDTVDAAGRPLAPIRILSLVNGVVQGSLHLETLHARNGRLFVLRDQPTQAQQVFSPPYFDLGETRLARGRVTLEIFAQDISGNERVLSFQLSVE